MLPHSEVAEKGVLSSILQFPLEAMPQCVEKISAAHFVIPRNQTIYGVFVELWEAGKLIDYPIFPQELRDRKVLEAVGGEGYIADLQTFVPSPVAVQYYIGILREKCSRREAIAAAQEITQRAHDEQTDVAETLEFAEQRFESIHERSSSADLPKATNIIALAEIDPSVYEADTLLGNRFLCVEGGMLIVAPSGIGKSSAGVHQDTCWALGQPAFGIRPARALRILCLQAENDDGDLAEMARGVCEHLALSVQERDVVRQNVIYVSERAATGSDFLRLLRALVRKHRPDIVRIDPLQAYAGGDVRDPAVTTPFLRNGLNPILHEFRCASIINHHTPKTIHRDTSEWKAIDWMYAGAGNADITNWARAILVIDATNVHGVFMFHAAKRGSRIGWADEDGQRVYDRLFCHHAGDSIFWRDATDDDEQRVALTRKGQPAKTKEDFKALVPLDESIPKEVLIHRATLIGIGDNRARKFLAELVEAKELYEHRVKRSGTNPQVRIARHEQTLLE
jgi:hypothetical protein